MEQHPVPQNVTTFQFRLIGDMTIKQFGYLAGGAILAYISYKLPLPFFFTWPLTIIFGLGGIGFAFVPIEERPMDIWVLSFLKNCYSPTLFVWEKSLSPQKPIQATPTQPISTQAKAMQPSRPAQPQGRSTADIIGTMYTKKPAPAPSSPPPVSQSLPHSAPQVQVAHTLRPTQHPKKDVFDWIAGFFSPKRGQVARPATTQMAAHMATPTVVGSHLDLSTPPIVTSQAKTQAYIQEVEKKEEILQEKASTLTHELEHKSLADARILELQKQLTEVLAQKDKMEAEVASLKKLMMSQPPANQQAAPINPPPTPEPVHSETQKTQKQPTVKIITPEGAVKAGLPRLTTFPNVVTGIVKDSDSNLLPGVLVTVKDTEGVPVRALKTNRLGQFAASTPLSNGVYFVEIEDPRFRYTFDRVQITLNGSIVPALEIIAKSQKQLIRDKLTKEIFGNTV